MIAPPLGLYVHIPWCIQKCPYCDFNSHTLKSPIPEQEYIAHLLADLTQDAELVRGRTVDTLFIGGGTPSLLSVSAMHTLLQGIKDRVNLAPNAEITMEANPGTVESDKFIGFNEAGVNRISIGIQSFANQQLEELGRIHTAHQGETAAKLARQLNLNSFNLDIMHGLPKQSMSGGLNDLTNAIHLQPPHLSWYQLTIEPNTSFHSKPPTLPDDDVLWDIQEQGQQLLEKAGYIQYEISAFSQPEHQCQHNLNYWRFGDYLGIGCGAHGKITDEKSGTITRTSKVKHPKGYMDMLQPYMHTSKAISNDDLAIEFFMNRLRLTEPCPIDEYSMLTGASLSDEDKSKLRKAQDWGLLSMTSTHWQVLPKGRRYLNTLLELLV